MLHVCLCEECERFYYADGSLNLFLEADIDATMNVNTDLEASFGINIFGHSCSHYGRKTVHADLIGRGKIIIRAQVRRGLCLSLFSHDCWHQFRLLLQYSEEHDHE